MPRQRSDESEEEHLERLEKVAQDRRKAGADEEKSLDAMVRKSIEQHGP